MNKHFFIALTVLLVGFGIGYVIFKAPAPAVAPVEGTPEQTPDASREEEEKTMNVSLYFPNSIQDPGFMDCRVVRPVTRTVPYTEGVATAAINELIKGLTAQEMKDGFVTQIDPDTRIQSLSIKDGVASVDLSKELASKNVGLCAGQFIQAQVEQTLLQFPTIQKVVVSIDGDKEFVQP